MTLSPDELRAQRDLVKRHLDWLEARLAETSGVPVRANQEPVAPTNPEPGAAFPGVTPPAGTAVEALLESHAGEGGLPSGAKFGCIAFAAVLVIGFVSLIFVLPRFLYGDKKPAPVEKPGAVQSPGR